MDFRVFTLQSLKAHSLEYVGSILDNISSFCAYAYRTLFFYLNPLDSLVYFSFLFLLLNSCINPLVPSAHKSVRISKISILKLEGIIKKISYERRDYESVDEKGLS